MVADGRAPDKRGNLNGGRNQFMAGRRQGASRYSCQPRHRNARDAYPQPRQASAAAPTAFAWRMRRRWRQGRWRPARPVAAMSAGKQAVGGFKRHAAPGRLNDTSLVPALHPHRRSGMPRRTRVPISPAPRHAGRSGRSRGCWWVALMVVACRGSVSRETGEGVGGVQFRDTWGCAGFRMMRVQAFRASVQRVQTKSNQVRESIETSRLTMAKELKSRRRQHVPAYGCAARPPDPAAPVQSWICKHRPAAFSA